MYNLNNLEKRMKDGDPQAAAELRHALEVHLPRIVRAVLRRPDTDSELARRIRGVADEVRRRYDVEGFQLVQRVTRRLCEALLTNPAWAGTWAPRPGDTLPSRVPARAAVAV
jgi:hypothetical protein